MTHCPHCGERVCISFDKALLRWWCDVCGRWWRE